MSTLEQIPGAGLLVDCTLTITDSNNRCQVVFEEDVEEICGADLETLREWGLFDEETLRTWESAVATVQNGNRETVTERVTLTPADRGEEFSYALRVSQVDTEPADEVCCSLRSVGTGQRYDETITALHAATRDLMTADSRDEVLTRTAAAANEVLGFPGTGVRTYDPETETLRSVSLGARVNDIDSRPPYPVHASPHGEAFRRSETIIDDIEEDDPFDREVFTQTMYIPIGGTALLSLGTVGGTFDETDVQFGEILAENAAAALKVVETTTTLRKERERLDLLKQILTRVLRHNIRNYANVIKGNTELLTDECDSNSGAAERIIDCTDDILELSEKAREIETIVDSARSRNRIDVARVVERAVECTSREFPGATIETDLDTCRVLAHESLGLVVENLLENACEHTDGTPTVTVGTTVGDDTVSLEVVDDGPGISQEEVEVLESEGETDLSHGSGLGLWIVKLVVELSQGTVDFETSPEGTRVTLTLLRATPVDA